MKDPELSIKLIREIYTPDVTCPGPYLIYTVTNGKTGKHVH